MGPELLSNGYECEIVPRQKHVDLLPMEGLCGRSLAPPHSDSPLCPIRRFRSYVENFRVMQDDVC
jgi:hypothetical protein